MAKHTQAQVDYRRGYPMRQCGVCSMYTHGGGGGQYGGCTAVTGQITTYGVCDLFYRLNNPFGHKLTTPHWRAIKQVYDHAHGYSSSTYSVHLHGPRQRY
jgi:hypothetical protein